MRLLKWIRAYAGLSAVWFLSDGDKPELDLAVAELAAAELAKAWRLPSLKPGVGPPLPSV